MLRAFRSGLIALALIASILVVLVAATPQGRVGVRTVLFLPQVLPTIPIKPQEWFTPDPVLREIEFPVAEGNAVADLYVPGSSGRHSAVVFFMGVIPPDRDEERIVSLAEGLARAGMVVMIPWLDTQESGRIETRDLDSLVFAFQYLRSHESVKPDNVGMAGISTGASMVTVAAQDERIMDQVRFINFFAGYYDAVQLAKAVGSRSRFYGDYVRPWKPDKLTRRVFTRHLVDGVANTEDRELLTRIFIDKVEPVVENRQFSSAEAVAVSRLINGVPFEEVDGLIDQLSPETLEFLRLISPSTHVDNIKARVFIMHDRSDRLVPSEESRRFADALGEDHDTYYTEFSFFQKEIQVHADDNQGVGLLGFAREAFKLFLHMYSIMVDQS